MKNQARSFILVLAIAMVVAFTQTGSFAIAARTTDEITVVMLLGSSMMTVNSMSQEIDPYRRTVPMLLNARTITQ